MEDKTISPAVIKRLPRYYRYLGDLLDKEVTRISSEELSAKMNSTASQVRQDLNNFGSFGQQGYGYNVELLYNEIKSILGLFRSYSLIIIGAGNFGQSLANYANFKKRGYNFTALFDIDPKLIGQLVNGIQIYGVDTLAEYLRGHEVDIAVLTLPKTGAAHVAQILFDAGVKGIWNFSHTDLNPPDSVVVENVHLTDSLMTLTYNLTQK